MKLFIMGFMFYAIGNVIVDLIAYLAEWGKASINYQIAKINTATNAMIQPEEEYLSNPIGFVVPDKEDEYEYND